MKRNSTMERATDQRPRLSAAGRTWRVTTATRVFVLAMGFGLAGSGGELTNLWATIGALCILTAFMAAVDSDPTVGPVLPIAEGALLAVIVSAVDARTEPILVCLLVPPLVAALRYGVLSSLAAVLAEFIAAFTVFEASAQDSTRAALEPVLPWLAVGLGVGLLAAWMRSSHRALERSQAPYEAAHQLLSQLHAVSRTLPVGLDTRSIAAAVIHRAEIAVTSARSVVLLGRSGGQLIPLAHTGSLLEIEHLVDNVLVRKCWTTATSQTGSPDTAIPRVCLPLRVGTQMVGVLVVDVERPLEQSILANVQPLLDEQSLRLDTALLFDEVRALATTEERNRLAREIHDGVAQEVASLGYLIDDLAAGAESAEARDAASFLRREVTRVVGELRLSIFDLRHQVDRRTGLGTALSDYAQEAATHSGLSIHLDIEERTGALQPDTEAELLRIAQEAITNVRKHAHARNMWVALDTASAEVKLRIEDDGIGAAGHRDGHYGLHTMTERAESIGATTSIHERVGGGTVVDIHLSSLLTPSPGVEDADHGVARRRSPTHPRRAAARVRAQR